MIDWRAKTRSQLPIGLDIGHNSIKMIQLAVNGGHLTVLAADEVRIDPAVNEETRERRGFIIAAIERMLADNDFRGKRVVSSLPNERMKITSLRLADSEVKEVEHVLSKEVVQRFGLDPDKDVVNYMHAGTVRHGDEVKNELILFAAANETIKEHIEMLEEAQLRPIAIDPIPCALFRSFERLLRRHEDKEHTVVFVDVGAMFTTVVFARGGEITFIKQIPIGGEEFSRQIAERLGIKIHEAEILRERLRMERVTEIVSTSPEGVSAEQQADRERLDPSTRQVMIDAVGSVAEDLGREIALCFRYYTVTFRGKRVERAIFAGGGAYDNTLLSVLRRQLTVEIEVAQPLKGFDMTNVNFDSDRRGLLSEWTIAVGLGLKGWKGSRRQGDYERN